MNTAKAKRFASAMALWISVATAPASAQLYSQNFEVDSTAAWTTNYALGSFGSSPPNFFFDYSTVGIPPGPSGAGTRGMKLQANLTGSVFSGMSVSPIVQSFTGDYIVRFDWWSNINGPFPQGGNGATNLSTFGIGTSGFGAQWPGAGGGGIDSVFFAATGDGGSAADWRAYSPAVLGAYPDGSPIYAATGTGNRNNTHPHYAIFGNIAAPAAQTALFPLQSGVVATGAAGMAWHKVRIRKSSNIVTWTVDGLLIATVDLNTVGVIGTNILFGHSDVNDASSSDPVGWILLFTLIDNIAVTRPADIVPSGQVNVDDLLAVVNQWGACPGPPATCAADIAPGPNGDGMVNIDDLLFVINNWG